jgi:hypothetical protein
LVADALRQMIERHQSCVLVVDDQGHAIGVLTERDIVTLTSDQVPTEQLTLYEDMHAPVITIRPRKPLHAAVKSMEDARIRRLVVTDEKDVACGLLTHHEVARGLEGDYVAYLKEMVEMQASTQAQGAQGVDERLLLANILRSMTGTAALASDLDYRISYASPNVEAVLGPRVEDMAGADLRDTLKATGWSAAAASLTEQALASGGRRHGVTIDGGKVDFQVSLLLDDQKNAKGYLVLARKA